MFKPDKAVVIGTGAGGLAAAGYLAQAGFEVVALEQGAQLGGNLGCFERQGFTFDTGLHYVGQCGPGELVHQVLGGIGLDAKDLFVEIEPDGFDIYRFPDFEIANCHGIDVFRDRLRARFPDEDYGLIEVFALIRALRELQGIGVHAPHGRDLSLLLEIPALLRWSGSTFGSLLSHWIDDPSLRAVLAAPCGDYALPPERASAFAGLGILAHYADGAYYPRGGSGALRDALVGAATRHGATFRTLAKVRAILHEGAQVTGVELDGGERIMSRSVISDVDPTVTFGRLLGSEALSARLRRKVARMEPSLGAFVVHLGMRRDLRSHGMSAANIWSYPSTDIDGLYAPMFHGALPKQSPLFLSSGSLKDGVGRLAPQGCSTLDVVTFIPEAIFGPWAGDSGGKRGLEYHEVKEKVADWVLEQVEQRMPGLIGDVLVREVSTPLTWSDYLGAPHGGAYGPAATPHQMGPWRFGTRTPFAGLFLAGQGVFGNGVAPSLMSGRVAALAAERAARSVTTGRSAKSIQELTSRVGMP